MESQRSYRWFKLKNYSQLKKNSHPIAQTKPKKCCSSHFSIFRRVTFILFFFLTHSFTFIRHLNCSLYASMCCSSYLFKNSRFWRDCRECMLHCFRTAGFSPRPSTASNKFPFFDTGLVFQKM